VGTPPPHGRAQVAYVLLILSALCFAGAWVAGKVAVRTMPPMALAVGRFAVASLLLWAWAARRDAGARRPSRADVPFILGMGVTAVAGYNVLFFYGLERAPASDGALIVPGLTPVLAAVMGRAVLKERIAAHGVVGLLVAVAGLVLVMAPGGGASRERLAGDVLFALGALAWAAYTILGKVATARFEPVRATLYGTLAGTLMLIPLALAENGWAQLMAAPTRAWAGLVYLGTFATVVSFVFLYEGVHRLGAARASSSLLLIPVFGVLLSAGFLHEHITGRMTAGGVLVILGLILVQARNRRMTGEA